MLKKIILSSLFLCLLTAVVVQFWYILEIREFHRNFYTEYHQRYLISEYEKLLDKIDEEGPKAGHRALIIAQGKEIIRLKKWAREHSVELSEDTKKLLDQAGYGTENKAQE